MLQIRKAVAADAPVLTKVAHAAKRHWKYDEALIALWRESLTVTPGDIESDVVFCAETGGRIAGFYSVSYSDGRWEVEHLWVRPDSIGRGAGRALFEHLRGEIAARGAKSLRIESDPNAEGFYRKMGARRAGEVPSSPAGRMLPVLVLDL
jgi:ribosomal protein S18 acetylase RimI-like enzyme